MLWLTFIALQAVDPSHPNNSLLTQPRRCHTQSSSGDEVVVCGRREGQSPYRIGPQPPAPPTLPNAEFKISDGIEAKLSGEQGEIGGIPTNRAMISLKIKF